MVEEATVVAVVAARAGVVSVWARENPLVAAGPTEPCRGGAGGIRKMKRDVVYARQNNPWSQGVITVI